jgi:sugar (pentulose or hexulose) kinase
MTAGPLLIGADVGTTNLKVVAFDRSGQPVTHANTSTPTPYPRPGWAHYGSEELWRSFASTLQQVTRIAPVATVRVQVKNVCE